MRMKLMFFSKGVTTKTNKMNVTATEVAFYCEVNFGSQLETYDVETDVTSGMVTIAWTRC